MSAKILKHRNELARLMATGNYEFTEGGILIRGADVLAKGEYFASVNGGPLEHEGDNLLPDEGLLHMLNVVFGATAKVPAWYLALFSGQINPAANWSASNFAATANEIVSATEGYSNATRPGFATAPAAANQITNLAAKATFNIVCTTTLSVEGAALLSNSGKGSTSGVLASASRYNQPRLLYNGDTYDLGYGVTLTA
ncbi:MAG TPA: hypothetical protein DCR72_10590 [Pseudomonas sp.]|nr:hypothetical protein [Pseudomonas sp.]